MRTKTSSKWSFTLLELMVALALMVIAGGVIGIRMHKGLQEKRLDTAAGMLMLELRACREMAMAMQADWRAVLAWKGGKAHLQRICPELQRSESFSWDAPCVLEWDGKPTELLVFQFAATGTVLPRGTLRLHIGERSVVWQFPAFFGYADAIDP